MKKFYTSDHHFYHHNIIKYCKRPFNNVQEMNERMIQDWNNVVTPEDEVYYLGDFAFCRPDQAVEILDRLNGKKHITFGNHDRQLKSNTKFLQKFSWYTKDPMKITDGKYSLTLWHYRLPDFLQTRGGNFHLHLHGHEHGGGRRDMDGNIFDVGVDVFPFKPVTLEEIIATSNRKFVQ